MIAFVQFTACASPPLPAGTLTFAWDPSADPSVVGYRLYRGTASQTYTTAVDVGQNTAAVISGLLSEVTYYFAVTAYDNSGVESPFSGEISYTVPANAPRPASLLPRLSIAQDASGQVLLTGTGPAGFVYDVCATQDFSSWMVIGRVTAGPTGSFQFTDSAGSLLPARYYQLRQHTMPASPTP